MLWRGVSMVVAVVAVFALGCSRDQPRAGQWVPCTCPYLTDYDDVAKHELQVCVPPGQDAKKMAYDCASKLTHGPAEACTCQAPAGACDGTQVCQSSEYK